MTCPRKRSSKKKKKSQIRLPRCCKQWPTQLVRRLDVRHAVPCKRVYLLLRSHSQATPRGAALGHTVFWKAQLCLLLFALRLNVIRQLGALAREQVPTSMLMLAIENRLCTGSWKQLSNDTKFEKNWDRTARCPLLGDWS